jgi:hypothetical protein
VVIVPFGNTVPDHVEGVNSQGFQSAGVWRPPRCSKPQDYASLRAELAKLVNDFTPVINELWPRLEDHRYRWELHSYWLGHADVSFTLRTYVHAQPDALELAARSFPPSAPKVAD